MIFSADWFERHQRLFLTLLALPLIGRGMRRLLAIRPHDVGYRGRIVQPHAYTIARDDGTYTTDFRTHAKYAKRLYYQLRPLWLALHWWDMVIANPFLPVLNAGCDGVTTFFPDAGSPGSGSCSGVARNGEPFNSGVTDTTFTIIRAANGTVGQSGFTPVDVYLYSSVTSNQYEAMQRAFTLFDTSSLGGITVSAATISVYSNGKGNSLGSPDLHVAGAVTANPNSIAPSDYEKVSRGSYGLITYAAFTGFSPAYNDIVLNAAGLANIHGTGMSKFSWQTSWDLFNNFTGTWGAAHQEGRFIFESSDASGTANDPKLVVTWATVSGGIPPRNILRPRPFSPGLAR
jgi:hypothetical protein